MSNLGNLKGFLDMRGKLESKGKYTEYPLSDKDTIVIHHSLTKSGSAEAYARYHVLTLGWEGIGYHVVIERDGTIKLCNNLNARSYHVGNSNRQSIGICLTGDFRKGSGQEPTQEQKNALHQVVEALKKDVPSVKYVKRHQDMPGYSWKNCPGDGWDCFAVIRGEGVTVKNVAVQTATKAEKVSAPRPIPEFHEVQQGETFWSIANKEAGLSVAELMALNPEVKATALQVGMKLRMKKEIPVPTPKLEPKPEVKPAPKPAPKKAEVKFPLPNGVLKEGAKGAGVKQLQTALNELKFKCGVPDGSFGPKTKDAVKRFQSVHCNPADGIYGAKTKAAMEKLLRGA